MFDKVLKSFFVVFVAIWMIIIFSEYWRYNPNYSKAIELFQYYDLLFIFLGIGGALTWFLKKPRQKPIKYFNGITIFLSILFLDTLAVNRFTVKEPGLSFTMNGLMSHLGHFMGVAICLFLVYLLVRVLGGIFTSIFPPRISKTDSPLIQIAVGILIFTFFLFFLGTVGLLTPFIIVPVCLIIFGLYWRHTVQYFKDTLWTTINIPKELNAIGIFAFLFLAIFLALNFSQILRPFPIGSDSLRVYVNLPNLIGEYGSLVNGHQPYNWSIFMSTGLVVFGRMDVVLSLSFFGGLLTLFTLFRLSNKWLDVNYSALILLLFYSLPMVSFLSYMDMKVDMALLFYTLATLLVFYNWAAPPTDKLQTVKGIGLTKANLFFKSRLPSVLKQNHLLVLLGLLSGFAFGIKLTVLFSILALFCMVWFFRGSTLTFIAAFCICFAAVFILKLDAQPGLRQFHEYVSLLQWSLFGIGAGLMVYLFLKQKKKLVELVTYSVVIGVFFALPILPWLGKNLSETGQVSVHSLLNGKMASPSFPVRNVEGSSFDNQIIIPGLYQMPETPESIKELETQKDLEEKAEKKKKRKAKKNKNKNKKDKNKNKKNKNNKKEQKTKVKKNKSKSGVSEDLHRFMGYEVLPVRYLSLPYDVFIKTNISNFFIDIGFILLLLFPILFLFSGRNNIEWKSLLTNFTFIGLSTLLLFISIPSAFLNQNNLSNASDGLALLKSSPSSGFLGNLSDSTNTALLNMYSPLNDWLLSNHATESAITYPLLILLFLLILSMVYVRVQKHSKLTQSIIVFVLMYFFLWWILGSGASWYGSMLFCVPFIFLFRTLARKEKEDVKRNIVEGSLKKGVFLSVAVVCLFLAFTQRAANYNVANKETANRLYFPPVMKYTMGELNEKKLMDYHFPNVRQFVDVVNKDRRSLVYMIGSPCNYFINKNDSRVLSDTFLDFFDKLVHNYKSKDKIIGKLKEAGFKYIIFDLRMSSYDVTPEKTLTKKFTQFLNTLYANPKVEWLSTDRKIQLNSTGEEVFGVFPDKGPIVNFGNIAVFRIK